MYNLNYKTEQDILYLKEILKDMIDNRKAIINTIGEDEFREKAGDIIMTISDLTQILLDNSILN
jgi:archaellum biogenesis ATPase FlaH